MLGQILIHLGNYPLLHIHMKSMAQLRKGARRSNNDERLHAFCSNQFLYRSGYVLYKAMLLQLMPICDFHAAAALINGLSPQLHRFFVAQLASRTDADDLLQETWLRIHKARHTYRPGEPVLPWLYAIARNIRVDHYRKSSRTTGHEQPLDETPEAETAAAEEPNRIPNLELLLATLPESQREVITLLKVEGMSLEEVARATSSSIGSVKQKAHRGYEKLRERLTMLGLGKKQLGERHER